MSVSRRELLLALGVTALPACKALRRTPGRIVGASVDTGHRLRGALHAAPSREERARVVVVGAGPSGLAAAWRLRALGERDVVVLDLEDAAGGTSRSGTEGVVPHPWGAHYLPIPRRENRALVALLRELGAIVGEDDEGRPIPREDWVVRDPEERLFEGGQWHDGLFPKTTATEADTAEYAKFHARIDAMVRLRDGRGRRAFDLPLERSSDDPDFTALDRITATEWLRREGFESPRVRWLVDYACRDDYGLQAAQTSAWAALFYFAARIERSGAEAAPLFAWPEGNGRLVSHLARGARIETRRLVVDVAPGEGGAPARVRTLDVAGGELVDLSAERVIVAVPKFVAARIVRPLRDERPDWLASFQYGSWLVQNLHLAARPRSRGAPLAWDNVLYDSPSLGYVVANHQTHVDEGPTILTHYFAFTDADPKAAREKLLAMDHTACVDLALADLAPAHRDFLGMVTRIDAMRWGHAMPRPVPGLLFGGARAKSQTVLGAIHFAHSDCSGLALFEEALHHGVRAAEEVARALAPDRPFESLLG